MQKLQLISDFIIASEARFVKCRKLGKHIHFFGFRRKQLDIFSCIRYDSLNTSERRI